MKGLDLCEQYFRRCGLPVLEKECGELLGKMAFGLVGDGSDCLGYDDELSRDHDWGPGFCIWLDGDDFQSYGSRIQNIYDSLPKTFEGFDARLTSRWGEGRIGVLEIGSFYQRYLGIPGVPQALRQWLAVPENALATATSGRVFQDLSGTFTAIREALVDGYPEDIRLKKIAARCMTVGQAGQYNFPRCIKRNELYAAAQAEMKFLESALSLIFLINNRYLPFYKWAHRAVRELPILGGYAYDAISKLVQTHGGREKEETIELFALAIIAKLKEAGLSDGDSDFLPDHGPLVQKHIRDPEIRGCNVWAG